MLRFFAAQQHVAEHGVAMPPAEHQVNPLGGITAAIRGGAAAASPAPSGGGDIGTSNVDHAGVRRPLPNPMTTMY